jgi:ribosomal protein L11 methyltransferase
MERTSTSQPAWVDVSVEAALDPSELLSRLDDPSVLGVWQDETLLHVYWPVERWNERTLARFQQALIGAGHATLIDKLRIDQMANRDWNVDWAKSVQPVYIGKRCLIRPSWISVPRGVRDVELVIDPKQAFGTGHHATTQLLIEWLEEHLDHGTSVLDVGTGSGILCMAALRLGASRARGIDCDEDAVNYAREYAKANGFGAELELLVGSLETPNPAADGRFDVVLANLDLNTLRSAAGRLGAMLQTGARVVVSGLLAEQKHEIVDCYREIGGFVRWIRERDGWLAMEFSLAESCERAE